MASVAHQCVVRQRFEYTCDLWRPVTTVHNRRHACDTYRDGGRGLPACGHAPYSLNTLTALWTNWVGRPRCTGSLACGMNKAR